MRITSKNLKDKQKLVKEAIHFFGDKLLGKRLAANIQIHVIGHDGMIDKQFSGLCGPTDYDHRPREFEIEINTKLGKKKLIQLLAHEMVHVRQFARGDLQERFRPKFHRRWKGVIVETDLDYLDLPWEIEAYGMEEQLRDEYFAAVKKNGKR